MKFIPILLFAVIFLAGCAGHKAATEMTTIVDAINSNSPSELEAIINLEPNAKSVKSPNARVTNDCQQFIEVVREVFGEVEWSGNGIGNPTAPRKILVQLGTDTGQSEKLACILKGDAGKIGEMTIKRSAGNQVTEVIVSVVINSD